LTDVSDDFTRANAANLGANWTDAIGGHDLVSNQAQGETAGTDHVSVWAGAALGADHEVQVTLGNLQNATRYGGGVVRWSGTSGYAFITDGSSGAGHTELAKWTSGSYSVLQAIATTFSNGDVLKLTVSGTTLRCYKNGAQVGADETDSDFSTGQPGVETYGTALLDDWSATDGAAAVATAGPLANRVRLRSKVGGALTA
jgi:hypothetical protein